MSKESINTDSTYNLHGVKSQASIDGGSDGSGSSDGTEKVQVGKNPAPVPGPTGKTYSFIVVEFLFNFVYVNE